MCARSEEQTCLVQMLSVLDLLEEGTQFLQAGVIQIQGRCQWVVWGPPGVLLAVARPQQGPLRARLGWRCWDHPLHTPADSH